MTTQLLLLALAYVAGATPTSLWVGRAFHSVDLREHGSGNLGATNAYRVLGWRSAVPVVIVDVLKGWGPTAIFPLITPNAPSGWAIGYGAAAIAGHVFSFWLGFKGGKGVATSAGVFLALAPWAALIAILIWLTAVFSTGYVSLGSILAALTLPIAISLTPHRGGSPVLVFTLALAALILWAHRGNVQRLLRGEENRFGSANRS